ncbi:hypothetical protein DFA_08328 [Cavenderia fasciculata]|uniref:Uncharacterized protein n=1 Tax=Cavenderia fasciculata TaxID=261658 RepID=F4Q5S4_CACFS|nr:uncharacterized protein DFA_08328 [Cavenderia fasciculata]EGG17333.1 hypothetical protein DFA_08328 [Cavenderia fasciculata]|eukprot:XP_004355817.1 hypothetical protein DFA_08328 [Cavenderia fasciculata]
MTSLLSLSNLLISQIISSIDYNGDIICLLLTTKKLYHNSSLRRFIQFKGTRVFDDNGHISHPFYETALLFKLFSFKDILENSVSDNKVLLPEKGTHSFYPQWIKDRINVNRNDQSTITTALMVHYESESLKSLYKVPSIDTLFAGHGYDKQGQLFDLGSISLLPNLQRLVVSAYKLNLGPHTTLKSLTLHIGTKYPLAKLGLVKFTSLTKLSFETYCVTNVGPGLLPSSLTSLTMKLLEIPPRDTFLSLTSLVTLDITLESEAVAEDMKEGCIDLDSLCNLKTLSIIDHTYSVWCYIEVSIPPSITILTFKSALIKIPTLYTMPLLEKLYVTENVLIDKRINLLPSKSIKNLVIYDCDQPLPANSIPSTLETLSIHKTNRDSRNLHVLGNVVLPPSLTHLSMLGDYDPVKLPESLVKLEQTLDQKATQFDLSLPRHLKSLCWTVKPIFYPGTTKFVFPTSSSYPPDLETLKLFKIEGCFIDTVPPVTKYLSIPLQHIDKSEYDHPIYSLTSVISETTTYQQSQWLPPNTTHLTCRILDKRKEPYKIIFRLDEIINHTNVRHLSLIITEVTHQFTIQRLDPDNRSVLVVQIESLQGGIITQRKTIKKNQYDPIYLYFSNSFIPDLVWKIIPK